MKDREVGIKSPKRKYVCIGAGKNECRGCKHIKIPSGYSNAREHRVQRPCKKGLGTKAYFVLYTITRTQSRFRSRRSPRLRNEDLYSPA